MRDEHVWSADEFLALPADEQQRLFESRLVRNLDDLPTEDRVWVEDHVRDAATRHGIQPLTR